MKEMASTAGFAARVGYHIVRERIGRPTRPLHREDVPPSPAAVTTEWLTAVLCRDVPGARVEHIELGRGDDGTSSRRALTVSYNAAGTEAGLPINLFTKSTATFASRLLLGLTEIVKGEELFYNRARPVLSIRSPRSFHACFDPRSYRSVVLLEDLAVAGWTFPSPMENVVSRNDAEDMVAEMARYHAAFWNSPRIPGDLAALRPALQWQENLNRKTGFERRTMRGFERAREIMPQSLYLRRDEFYPAFMRSLALHDRAPKTLLHQDVHLGNWLRDPDGRMGLYDWQCVAVGHWALDVSYALACCLRTEDRRLWERDLIDTYLKCVAAEGVDEVPSRDEAWLAYRQQPMHALAFALFTFGGSRFEPELQPRDYTMEAIRRIAQHVADTESLDALR